MSRGLSFPWLLLAGAILSFSLTQPATARGGGGGHGGGGFGGGHFGGGGFGGGHFGGGYGGFSGSHFGGFGGERFGGYSGAFSSPHFYGGGNLYSTPTYRSAPSAGQGLTTRGGAAAFGREPALGLGANQAFRSNWNRDFDRGHLARFRHGEERGERERFSRGGGFFPYWGVGYPGLDFSYLPYGYGYGNGHPLGDYGEYTVGAAPHADYSDYSVPMAASDVVSDYGEGAEVSPVAESKGYLSEAVDAFYRGDYQEAVRLGEHAAVDAPQDVVVHRLLSQAFFALGAYPAAAIEAHAALALGPTMDWATLASYYGDAPAFTAQLRALEKYDQSHPKAADADFLLGYQYLMMGYRQQAGQQFAHALDLVPADKVAAKVLGELGVRTAAKAAGGTGKKVQ
jgi:hypothetical protein